MKPGKQIILLHPDDLQSGPTKEWVEQFANNLKLISGRYHKGLAAVKLVTPKEKEAGQLASTDGIIMVLFHESWISNGGYKKIFESGFTDKGDDEMKVIIISTSPGRRQALGGKLEKLPYFSIYNPQALETGSGLIDESMPAYWSKLLDIVLDLGQTGLAGSGTIYLAETETDISGSRDILRRELMEQGYRVVPEDDLTGRNKDLKSHIQKCIEQSRLIIHRLGNHYGDLVENESISISELQVRNISQYLEAIEKNETPTSRSGISRLIWVDPDFNPQDKQQAEFVEELKRDIEKLHRIATGNPSQTDSETPRTTRNTSLTNITPITRRKLFPKLPAL